MKPSTLLLSVALVSVVSFPVLANEKTVTKTEDGRTISRTLDTKKGTVKIDNNIKKTGEGTWESTRTITGPDGKTKTIDTKATKTETGIHKDQTWTGKDGEAKSRSVDINKNQDGSYTKKVTASDGKTYESTGTTRKEAHKHMLEQRKDKRKAVKADKQY